MKVHGEDWDKVQAVMGEGISKSDCIYQFLHLPINEFTLKGMPEAVSHVK